MAFGEGGSGSGEKDVFEPMGEYEECKARQESKRKARGQPHCISDDEEYILWKARQGWLAKGSGGGKVEQEEEKVWEERMAEGKIHRVILREYLRNPLGQAGEGKLQLWV